MLSLSLRAIRVLRDLASGDTDHAPPALAARAGMSERTWWRAIRELRSDGRITAAAPFTLTPAGVSATGATSGATGGVTGASSGTTVAPVGTEGGSGGRSFEDGDDESLAGVPSLSQGKDLPSPRLSAERARGGTGRRGTVAPGGTGPVDVERLLAVCVQLAGQVVELTREVRELMEVIHLRERDILAPVPTPERPAAEQLDGLPEPGEPGPPELEKAKHEHVPRSDRPLWAGHEHPTLSACLANIVGERARDYRRWDVSLVRRGVCGLMLAEGRGEHVHDRAAWLREAVTRKTWRHTATLRTQLDEAMLEVARDGGKLPNWTPPELAAHWPTPKSLPLICGPPAPPPDRAAVDEALRSALGRPDAPR